MVPVMVNFDDRSRPGFEIEGLADGRVVVYLPGAPDPWSGSVAIFTADCVEDLPVTALVALDALRLLGRMTNRFVGVQSSGMKAG